jgi:hypothetical protein
MRHISQINPGLAPLHFNPGLYTGLFGYSSSLNSISVLAVNIGNSIFADMRLGIGQTFSHSEMQFIGDSFLKLDLKTRSVKQCSF